MSDALVPTLRAQLHIHHAVATTRLIVAAERLTRVFPRRAFEQEKMPADFSNAELEAYLDESLSVARMAAVEDALRADAVLADRLGAINGRRDAGLHSLGEIWRRRRLSCPTREQLGSFLLSVLADDVADYVRFHLESVGCRFCAANVEDLRSQQSAADADQVEKRRHRYFHSSAGYLRKRK